RRRKDSREDALGAEMPRAEREQRQRGGRCVLLYACPREGRRPGQFGSGDLRDRSSRSRGYESGGASISTAMAGRTVLPCASPSKASISLPGEANPTTIGPCGKLTTILATTRKGT